MRAALVTTAIVLLVLVAYSCIREAERRGSGPPAPVDVAAPPAGPAADEAPALPAPRIPALPNGEATPAPPVPALPEAPPDETPREAGVDDKPTQYVVAPGDSLWSIAHRFYRDGRFARAIYEANRDQIQRPQVLHPGQKLVLP
jgi:nucleoid-associated protein YgaU